MLRDKLRNELHNQCVVRNIPQDVENAMFAQAQLESGSNISSRLSTDAFNFWGMKCGSRWNGVKYPIKTREHINGKDIVVNAEFRAYDGVTEGVWGYFDFLSMPIYEGAIFEKNADSFMTKVCRHWATDPSYRAKWRQLYHQIEFYETSNPKYVKGQDYTIIASGLAVRLEPSVSSQLVGYGNLTVDGKKHDVNKNGYLDRGTVVTVKGISQKNDEIWLLIPSGWICAEMNGEVYVK